MCLEDERAVMQASVENQGYEQEPQASGEKWEEEGREENGDTGLQ